MPQKNMLDFKRIAKAIAAAGPALDAVKRQPDGHYTSRQLTAELAQLFGPGKAGRRIVLDGIQWLERITKQIAFRHKNGRKEGDYYIYTAKKAA
jgi:hypothetical protein